MRRCRAASVKDPIYKLIWDIVSASADGRKSLKVSEIKKRNLRILIFDN